MLNKKINGYNWSKERMLDMNMTKGILINLNWIRNSDLSQNANYLFRRRQWGLMWNSFKFWESWKWYHIEWMILWHQITLCGWIYYLLWSKTNVGIEIENLLISVFMEISGWSIKLLLGWCQDTNRCEKDSFHFLGAILKQLSVSLIIFF